MKLRSMQLGHRLYCRSRASIPENVSLGLGMLKTDLGYVHQHCELPTIVSTVHIVFNSTFFGEVPILVTTFHIRVVPYW